MAVVMVTFFTGQMGLFGRVSSPRHEPGPEAVISAACEGCGCCCAEFEPSVFSGVWNVWGFARCRIFLRKKGKRLPLDKYSRRFAVQTLFFLCSGFDDYHLSVHSDMATVAKAMACPDSGLEVRDRMWLKITIANAFIGSFTECVTVCVLPDVQDCFGFL